MYNIITSLVYLDQRILLASLSHSKRLKKSPSLTGPLTFLRIVLPFLPDPSEVNRVT